jgi:hypothetical protein
MCAGKSGPQWGRRAQFLRNVSPPAAKQLERALVHGFSFWVTVEFFPLFDQHTPNVVPTQFKRKG